MDVYVVLYDFYNEGEYGDEYYADNVFYGVYSTWDKAIEAIEEEVKRDKYANTENYNVEWITRVEDDDWEDSMGQVLNLDYGDGDYISSWHTNYYIKKTKING